MTAVDCPVGAEAQNTRPRFSAAKLPLNRGSRRARARKCKGGSTTTRAGRGKSGLFLNNRHYDPTTGIFVSVDPLVTKTMQPYIYGAANPVTYSDPSGLCIEPSSFQVNDDGSYSYIPMGGPECSDWDDEDNTNSPELPATRDSYGIKSDVKRVEHGIGGAFAGPDSTLASVAMVGGALYGGAFLASNATWRTGVSLAGDKARDWWRGRNAGPAEFRPNVGQLADELASATGGSIKELRNGYTIGIPNGGRGIVVRIMSEGGGRTNYYRASIPGKDAFTVNGVGSTDRLLTHIDISRTSLQDILNIIRSVRG